MTRAPLESDLVVMDGFTYVGELVGDYYEVRSETTGGLVSAGRHTIRMFACDSCAAIVGVQQKHIDWHKREGIA